jgi:hypothetical protein
MLKRIASPIRDEASRKRSTKRRALRCLDPPLPLRIARLGTALVEDPWMGPAVDESVAQSIPTYTSVPNSPIGSEKPITWLIDYSSSLSPVPPTREREERDFDFAAPCRAWARVGYLAELYGWGEWIPRRRSRRPRDGRGEHIYCRSSIPPLVAPSFGMSQSRKTSRGPFDPVFDHQDPNPVIDQAAST